MSQENVEIIRQVFEASRTHDSDAVLALYDRDVELDLSCTLGLEALATVCGHDEIVWFTTREEALAAAGLTETPTSLVRERS